MIVKVGVGGWLSPRQQGHTDPANGSLWVVHRICYICQARRQTLLQVVKWRQLLGRDRRRALKPKQFLTAVPSSVPYILRKTIPKILEITGCKIEKSTLFLFIKGGSSSLIHSLDNIQLTPDCFCYSIHQGLQRESSLVIVSRMCVSGDIGSARSNTENSIFIRIILSPTSLVIFQQSSDGRITSGWDVVQGRACLIQSQISYNDKARR